MALTQYYVDPAINANSGTGAIGDPFGDLQYGLNTVTRDATNGDQFNVKAGTAEVLAAPLTLATYGTPAEGAPLVLRGYTSAANDGGRGWIKNAGDAIITSSTLDYIYFIDLDLEGGGNPTRMITLDDFNFFLRCKFIANKGGAATAYLCTLDANNILLECSVLQSNGYGFSSRMSVGAGSLVGWCYSENDVGLADGAADGITIIGNVVKFGKTWTQAISFVGDNNRVIGNVVYNTAAGATYGIYLGNAGGRQNHVAINNIVCGQSGVGGVGIGGVGGNLLAAGYNAYWNNTTNFSNSGNVIADMSALSVSLAADPFTNAAAGDFSLTEAGKTALRSLGWPASYLGASTDPHVTIGAVQYGAAEASSGGGGPVIGSRIIRGLGAV